MIQRFLLIELLSSMVLTQKPWEAYLEETLVSEQFYFYKKNKWILFHFAKCPTFCQDTFAKIRINLTLWFAPEIVQSVWTCVTSPHVSLIWCSSVGGGATSLKRSQITRCRLRWQSSLTLSFSPYLLTMRICNGFALWAFLYFIIRNARTMSLPCYTCLPCFSSKRYSSRRAADVTMEVGWENF